MIKNWLVRGDTHGNFHWVFNDTLDGYNPDETAIIILGDAGFNFYLNKTDARIKREVNARGFRIYCVRGNHEARPQDIPGMVLGYDMDVKGAVYVEPDYPNIRYFKDYGTYKLGRYYVAVIGGAYSVDKWYRLHSAGVYDKLDANYNNPRKTGWFYNEQLSTAEMAEAEKVIFSGTPYDFVFTHTCPISWQPTDLFLSVINQDEVDSSMELWMDELKDKFDWNVWCFGHYHADRLERPHVEMYYNDIESLDTINDRWEEYDMGNQVDWWLRKSPNYYMT